MKKQCTKCKKEFPATKKHFYHRLNYSKTKKVCISQCKKCSNKQNFEIRVLKRCKEEGIERYEWGDFVRKQLMNRDIFKLKDERLKDIPRPMRCRILRKIREENYVFTTIKNYNKECSKNRSSSQRKYNYEADVLNDKIISKKMPDYYIANRLKMNLKDVPKEIIETKRILITLKRELKNNNVKIK